MIPCATLQGDHQWQEYRQANIHVANSVYPTHTNSLRITLYPPIKGNPVASYGPPIAPEYQDLVRSPRSPRRTPCHLQLPTGELWLIFLDWLCCCCSCIIHCSCSFIGAACSGRSCNRNCACVWCSLRVCVVYLCLLFLDLALVLTSSCASWMVLVLAPSDFFRNYTASVRVCSLQKPLWPLQLM